MIGFALEVVAVVTAAGGAAVGGERRRRARLPRDRYSPRHSLPARWTA